MPSAARILTVAIIFVRPVGETPNLFIQDQAIAQVSLALDWWTDAHPEHPTFTIAATDIVTTTHDLFSDLSWRYHIPPSVEADITIYLLDTHTSRKLLWGLTRGTAFPGFAAVTTETGQVVEIVTHELGHAAFNLSDLLAPCGADIMCNPRYAYPRQFIGCASLEALSHPCRSVFLPTILGQTTRL